jgi:hypothetical protein
MNMHAILLTAALVGGAADALAQNQASATIDGKTITVKYAPPAAASKRVVATLQADADIAFKGVKVPKGSYTVYVLTDGPQWQLAVNKATGAKSATYDPKLDLGKVSMATNKGTPAPGCKITMTKIAALAAKFEIAYNGTVASAPFHLDRGGNDSEW